ncbi:MAG: hypothetical protein VSS75_002540, partial [Candidatus Parabeggiatoa sp.]|nr:hypothetical protein [Candidatus Parabeggiatoa sp.]
ALISGAVLFTISFVFADSSAAIIIFTSIQLSVISYQLSVISYQLSVISYQLSITIDQINFI